MDHEIMQALELLQEIDETIASLELDNKEIVLDLEDEDDKDV